MFFGFTKPSPAGSVLSNLSFASRRSGRDRRAAEREMAGRMAALDHSQALVEIGRDGRVLDANAHFLALLGRTPDALIGQPYGELLTETERAGGTFRQFQDKLLRGEAVSARLSHAAANKATVALRVALMPVTEEDGKVARLFGVVTDETEIARDAVAGVQANRALDSVSVAIMMVDRTSSFLL
jgi:methyl-accepting chemotaxis protein